MSILIVDDSPDQQALLRSILGKAGHADILSADSGKAAARLLNLDGESAGENIDLILMDIRLPYEDGYQALQKVRANPRLKDTVVCAVTAEASEDQMRRAQKAGFNGFLGKPLDPDRFPAQIRRLLTGEEVWEWK